MLRVLGSGVRLVSTRRFPSSSLRQLSTPTFSDHVAPPGDGPNHRSIMSLDRDKIRPFVQTNAYVAPSATVIGSVLINDRTAILYNAVIRGDLGLIRIGAFVTVGEGSVLLCGDVLISEGDGNGVAPGLERVGDTGVVVAKGAGLIPGVDPGLDVGDYCVIGRECVLKDCDVGNRVVIGDRCVVEKGVVIGEGAQIEDGSVVKMGTVINAGELWGGRSKAEFKKVLTDDEMLPVKDKTVTLANLITRHANEFLPGGTAYWEKERLAKEKQSKHLEK
eukprot:Plantae.Rhodophyta-Hildenbrandia_rubra.ctg15562.p1 GENE.Plantae.Rhodophyta-Hildenbrandia_rubra.ctg15562~~Plantae.Rhodophyta-Hildenbrandia_rubra.ctg15562.p1  ORF type:complete len:276 (+),score=65.01 Plantae.Rhodophyta-Hildenbrandia_rubra.ctg15562:2087-2914(+)